MFRDPLKFPAERKAYGFEGIPTIEIPTSPDVLRWRFGGVSADFGAVIWQKSGVVQTHEIEQVVGELAKRNIFARSAGERFSPEDALDWAVDWALRNEQFRRHQLHAKSPYAIRYSTPKYIEDFDYYRIVGGAINAARWVEGRLKNQTPTPSNAGPRTYNEIMFGSKSWIKAGESWDSIWSKVRKVLGI